MIIFTLSRFPIIRALCIKTFLSICGVWLAWHTNLCKAQSSAWSRLYSLDGKLILSIKADTLLPLSNQLFAFRYGGKFGLINIHQEILQPPLWERIVSLNDTHYLIGVAGRWHHIPISKMQAGGVVSDWGRAYDEYISINGLHLLRHADSFFNREHCWDLLLPNGSLLGQACGMPSGVGMEWIFFSEPGGGGTLYHISKGRVAYFSKGKLVDARPPAFIIQNNAQMYEIWNGVDVPKPLGGTWNTLNFWGRKYVLAADRLHHCVLNHEAFELFCADSIWSLNNGYLGYKLERTFGIIDSALRPVSTGKLRLERPPRPTGIGHILIKNSSGTYLFDPNRRRHWKIKNSIEYIGALQEHMAPFMAMKRYGFVDNEGEIRVSARYDSVRPFKEGLAAVMLKGKWGFINKDEEIIIQPIYDKLSDLEQGLCIAIKDGLAGVLNAQGQAILPFQYDKIKSMSNDYYLIEKNQRVGCMHRNGEIIISVKFQHIHSLAGENFLVRREGKAGVVDRVGAELIPLESAIIDYYPQRGFFVKITTERNH